MSINLASKYSKKVSERWYRESQVAPALNNDYEFTGVETVKVYSIPVVAMSDYKRTGANRYGEPNNLARNVQTLTIKKDRGFTYTIDRGDHIPPGLQYAGFLFRLPRYGTGWPDRTGTAS
jgi:hypothetical protein